MTTLKIEITQYIFDGSEILVLQSDACSHNFILDIDIPLDDKLILDYIRGHYLLGDVGGLVRNGIYSPWFNLPISSDDALESCKWAKKVIRRTYTKIDNPDPTNPSIVSKEIIQ